MKFGSREIANVVFRAKSDQTIGATEFKPGQPVLYIDTATTSTLEGAATTVYAKGGRGYTNLVTWEGEKTLTFTVEDALLSPIGLAILSGAGLWEAKDSSTYVHVHTMSAQTVKIINSKYYINLTEALTTDDGTVYEICEEAPIWVMAVEGDGSITGTSFPVTTIGTWDDSKGVTSSVIDTANGKTYATSKSVAIEIGAATDGTIPSGSVMVDFYMLQPGNEVYEIQIDADKFAGYFYVEAETLFRRQEDGVDMPANLTFPNVKIQSNFSFSMSASGDPSTFTFTMDAMPGYTYFNKKKKVLCAIQVIDGKKTQESIDTVFGHELNESTKYGKNAAGEYPYPEWEQNDSYKVAGSSGQPATATTSEKKDS